MWALACMCAHNTGMTAATPDDIELPLSSWTPSNVIVAQV